MAKFTQIHWGRVMVGGFLAELLVFAIVFPTRYLFGQRAFLASILIASAVLPFLFAVWVGRRIESLGASRSLSCTRSLMASNLWEGWPAAS